MTKRNPSNQKFVHLQKYRFHARKVEDSKHAIYDVCERVWCCLTESRPPAVRRPGPSQIKMYGFCRLFRAMRERLLASFASDRKQVVARLRTYTAMGRPRPPCISRQRSPGLVSTPSSQEQTWRKKMTSVLSYKIKLHGQQCVSSVWV